MPIDKLFGSLNISASGLSAQRKKLDAISSNIANANTTRTENGEPYRRKVAITQATESEGFGSVLRRKTVKLATSNPNHFSGKKVTFSNRKNEISVETEIVEDQSEFRKVHDPSHPDADEEGFVYLPNVNMVSEMVDMISASRSYEANLSAMDAAKKMARAALDI